MQITKHGTACPLCVPFESKVLIDDVYSGGTWENSKEAYEKVPQAKRAGVRFMSEAMKQGLYHPRCRHGLGTFYIELLEDEKPTKAVAPKAPEKPIEKIMEQEAVAKAKAKTINKIAENKAGYARTAEEAAEFARKMGVKYVAYEKLPLETANTLNEALATLPDDVRPIFVGDSVSLETLWGGKLPRSSKHYYGVTVESINGLHLGYGKGYDFEATGDMVGISASYKTAQKVTEAKEKAQAAYQAKYGRKYFFNMDGKTTPFHEMGHVYVNAKGLPPGFENAAEKWAKETSCDMLKKPSEAWAEAWAAYHTKTTEIPAYIKEYIENVAKNKVENKTASKLLSFDGDGKIFQDKAAFKATFERGEIRTYISPQKQARHIKGSKQFNEYAAALKANGSDNLPSYIREDLKTTDLNKLVVSKLKGNVEMRGGGDYCEFVSCDEIIGYYYSPSRGQYIPTKRAMVKYALGDRNIHIVPVKEVGKFIYETES